MTTIDARPATALRGLYFTRFAFAIVWAIALVVSVTVLGASGTLNPLTIALLVLYPAFDLGSAVVDRRTSGATGPSSLLVVNMVLSLLAAIGPSSR